MKINLQNIYRSLTVGVFILLVNFLTAATLKADGVGGGAGGDGIGGGAGGDGIGGGAETTNSLVNPLKAQTVQELILNIIDVILVFLLPIIVLYIMYAGFLFVTAAGNSEKVSKARAALLWSVVGGVIALGAKLIVDVIQATVASI